MALIGMSKLEAVNEMLEAIGEKPVAALDTGGTSTAADAERVLDRIDRRIQSMGWPENTDFAVTIVSAAPTVVPSDTLWIRSTTQNRNYTLRADGVYDIDAGAALTGVTAQVDKIKKLTFADLAPRTKDLISVAASAIFQRRWRGDPAQAMYFTEEKIVQDIVADRIKMGGVERPINPYPISPSVQQPSGQGQ